MKLVVKPNKKINILLIDSDHFVRNQFKESLEKLKVFTTISEAADGVVGKMKSEKQNYDIIVADLEIPKLSCYEFISLHRKFEKSTVTQIRSNLVLTSKNLTVETVQKSKELMVKHIIRKPCSASEFQKKILEVIVNDLKDKVKILS